MLGNNIISKLASIVIVGYNCSGEVFDTLMKYKISTEVLDFKEQEQKINIKGEIKPPKEFIDNLKKQLPIRIYKHENIKITYSIAEQKIIININDFQDSNLEEISNIAKSMLVKEQLPFIFAVGINFSQTYEIPYKLKLFSEQIEQLGNWNKNKGFQIVLPIEETSNILATYKIEKNNEKIKENDIKIREYTTSVNFNYNLPEDKNIDNIMMFFDNINKYYVEFNTNNEKIQKIGQV